MSHPLDQISSEEIEKAVDLYKSHEKFDEETIFSNISLVEPEKQLLREHEATQKICLLYTSPSPRDRTRSRMPSSA